MEDLLKFFLERYRLQVGIVLIAAVLVGGGVLALTNFRSEPPEIGKVSPNSLGEATTSASFPEAQEKIKIDIAGAVVSPGVYEFSEGARVEDALNAAGGFSDKADRDWVSKNLNLATKLHDGDKLYVPEVGETSTTPVTNEPAPASIPSSVGVVSGDETSSDGESSNCSRVNINTASAGTLDECLSGIGPAYAQRIIEYRESQGGFKSIEEIQEVRGIGPKTFEKIKNQITVN